MVGSEVSLAYPNYNGRIYERNMKLIELDKLTALSFDEAPDERPYKVRYQAGFYPTGAALAVTMGGVESIFNLADPTVYEMLDRLSRQRDITLLAAGHQPEIVKHGRMIRQQLQTILRKASTHLPVCRLDWQATLSEFTRPNLVAR